MRNISLLVAFLLISFTSFAGNILGKIIDEKSGESIIGATVIVKGTSVGAASDIDGNFTIAVNEGTYTLEVRYIGYQSKEIEEVLVKNAEPTKLVIAIIESKSTELDGVVVRSTLRKENINALYSIQKNAAAISDGISADVIKKSPDRSTGEIMKRISGTTIQDNKFVIVRGLSDRYNCALIDNAMLPSTEPNRKAFSFDIIPAAMVDNIVITKAATPDLPGDFSGGVINILTKETPEQNFNSLSLGLNYNTVSTGQKFQSGYKTSTDIIGFDNGSRQLPEGFPTTSAINNINQQGSIDALKKLNNNFSVNERTAMPGMNLQAVLGRAYHLKSGNKLGLTTAVTYNHNETIKKDLSREYDNFDYTDNIYTYSSNLGALLNAGYYFGGNKIIFKTVYNRIFDDNFLYREGQNYSSTSDIRYYAFDLVQKSLFKTSLEGEHQAGKKQNKLGWLLSYNLVTNNQPDQRKVSYSRLINSGSDFSADNTSLGKSNNRLFGNLRENILNGGVNYTMPFKLFEKKSSLKMGVLEQYRYRDFSNRYIGAVLDNSYADADLVRTNTVENLLTTELIENGAYDLKDQTGADDSYTARSMTSAAYAMMDNKLTDNLRIVWGARFESYSLALQSGGGNETNPTWNDLLPSANITYSLNDKTNIRASYFRSVARPELREISPIAYYDYEMNAIIKGNSNLERGLINNMDLRYEVYPNPGEIISASVFYKNFNKTIENYVYAQNSSYEIQTVNFKGAQNIGVEVEVRKNLGFIAKNSFLKNMNFYANLAYIQSKVQLAKPEEINGKYFTERPLSGQSPYVVNTSLGYSGFEGKLNVNLLYNRIGQRLFLVGQSAKGNVYEMPRNLLDFQASFTISKRSELKLNIKDILNNPAIFYFDQDNDASFSRQSFANGHIDDKRDWVYQEYKPGTTFSLTYTFRF